MLMSMALLFVCLSLSFLMMASWNTSDGSVMTTLTTPISVPFPSNYAVSVPFPSNEAEKFTEHLKTLRWACLCSVQTSITLSRFPTTSNHFCKVQQVQAGDTYKEKEIISGKQNRDSFKEKIVHIICLINFLGDQLRVTVAFVLLSSVLLFALRF